jgi:hypothetical protein
MENDIEMFKKGITSLINELKNNNIPIIIRYIEKIYGRIDIETEKHKISLFPQIKENTFYFPIDITEYDNYKKIQNLVIAQRYIHLTQYELNRTFIFESTEENSFPEICISTKSLINFLKNLPYTDLKEEFKKLISTFL